MRRKLRFLRGNEFVELDAVGGNEMLLDYLRLREGSRGTKEACREGDCGACTVALGSLRNGSVVYEPVNACIHLLGMIDGKELVTVEDLAADGALHPVQQAMVDQHASQCGFCTPGFVMSLFTLYHEPGPADRRKVNDWIAGNLCRCTGYRPIVDAGIAACAGEASDRFAARRRETRAKLASIADREDLFIGDEKRFFASPASLDSLADLYAAHVDAVLVGGATDVGLWITKQLRDLAKVIHIGRVEGFDAVQEVGAGLSLGAGATYAHAEPYFARIDPDLGELLRRLGSKQVRACGTIGGNIANGSPIGDMAPALIALATRLELRHRRDLRSLSLEEFFLDYGKQDRRPGEFVSRLFVPRLGREEHFRCYKVSKRFDQDITAVLGAFRLSLSGRRVADARIAFGGMAATPRRALTAERELRGVSLAEEAGWRRAGEALAEDFQPISDQRASADYRLATARALLVKALREVSGVESGLTRVVGVREAHLGRVA